VSVATTLRSFFVLRQVFAGGIIKAAFHDIDIDTDTDVLARILARMSMSASMSVSWNAAFSRYNVAEHR